jgi:glycosyltransferase involved in cell wall biosynthesis
VDHLREVVGAEAAGKIHHIPNGVPLGVANQTTVGQASAPVLCVSRLVSKKGIDTLIEAVALAAPDDHALRLDLIGSGPLIDELHALVAVLGVRDRVRFFGARTSAQVEEAYSGCSLVALPCRIDDDGDRDGLPTVLVEALGRGVPVISTNVVGIPELVRHGVNGLLIEPDDAPALAAAITKLRSDPPLARSLGAAGRELVARAYDPAASARALRDLWKGLAR